MHNKPLRLDLSNFFTDERKCSLILLDVSWKNIKNLQDHIENLFHLNGISLLDSDGSYLPPKKSIEVLRDTYALKAFQFQNPTKDNTSVEMASTSTRKSTKRRINNSSDLELASSTPNNAKRSRSQLEKPSSTYLATMHNKPLRLDLSNFFTDERKCSLILLDVSWKNIKNLQDHIQNLFHLNGISLLDSDGSYLPPKESIEVLRDTYALKAFQFQNPTKDNTSVEMASTSTRKSTKRRINNSSDLELASSTPNNAKRSRNLFLNPARVFKFQNPIKEDLSNKENTLEIAVTEQESPLVSTQNLKADLSNKDGVIDPPIPRCPEVVLRCALLEIRLDTPRVFKLPRQESPVKILELKDIEPIRDAAKKSETEDQTPDLETSTETQINKIESTEKEEEAIEEVNTANVVQCNSDSEDDDVMVLEDSDSDVQPVAH
ncbi:coilin-like [Drosophila tropicalis]|uniref:coilin-like n=1 Tax=Drosophila tropicalis TaxID=46794 RepID=UPI0035ABE515